MRIMNNIPALQSYNALTVTNNALSKSIERLSTGLRINSAADDAAGLAISEKMRSQIKGLDQAISNAQNGISMVQIAEGALSETHSILQRMRELSVQAANDTLTQEDRGYIQLEVDQLKEEITRIANTTQFNKKKLLDGSAAALWSSSDLETKAIVNGGLRQVDQFGQKAAVEGNFRISINAEPGQAEVQKTDIFKIKHKNVIMNLSMDANNGIQDIEVDNLPAGEYTVYQGRYNSFGVGTAAIVYSTHTDSLSAVGRATAISAAYAAGGGDYICGVEAYYAAGLASGTTATVNIIVSVTNTAGLFIGGTYYAQGASVDIGTSFAVYNLSAAVNSGDSVKWSTIASGTANNLALANAIAANFTRDEYATDTYNVGSASFAFGGFYGVNSGALAVNVTELGGLDNASVLLEVLEIDAGTGDVTFRAQVNAMDADGTLHSYIDDNLIIGLNGVATGYDALGFLFTTQSAISIADVSQYDVGDKLVLNFQSTDSAATNDIAISATVDTGWPDGWVNPDGSAVTKEVMYRMDMGSLAGQTVQFKQFYLNSSNGSVYEGNIKITFNSSVKTVSVGGARITGAGSTAALQRASFEAAYIGQVAQSDVALRDIDKFWDANGKFLLVDPKEITINQGDGTNTKITIYATDTMKDLQKKLNDAIAYGLGQSRYVTDAANNFVSFVEETTADSSESVAGTLIIRSLIPGNAGTLSFSGDEDLIKAFSMNVIQSSAENTFRVSIADAHTAKMVATNQKISGNKLVGVLHPNIDVVFDPMANISIRWNDYSKSFELTRDIETYETILHLADNTTVFQVGANEGEDMALDIGDMSASSLGIDSIIMTDRESAARAITVLDNAIGKVSSQRGKLGAYQNRLEHTITNLTTASTNTTAAESRIRDLDMAKEMMEFTKLNILSQAGNSMLAQANQLPQNVLSLLRG